MMVVTQATMQAILRRQVHACHSQAVANVRQRSLSKARMSVSHPQRNPFQFQDLSLNLIRQQQQQQRHQSGQFRPRSINVSRSKNDINNQSNLSNFGIKSDVSRISKEQPDNDSSPSVPVASVTSDITSLDKAIGQVTTATSTTPNEILNPRINNQDNKNDEHHVDQALPNSVDTNPWTHMHLHEFAPKIVVIGVGGAGTNAVNNMVSSGLAGVTFLALNTDAQHLSKSLSPTRLQIGTHLTSGLGCGANPDAGRLAAEESKDAIQSCVEDAHMVFITAGMGGGTGTGAAPVVAGICYDLGILTVSVVTTPFRFEGTHRMRLALEGVDRLKGVSDTSIVVPNQNLFRLVGETTTFMDSFKLADDVLLAGVRSITDLMTSPGMINLDFADVQSVMHGMGNALLGTGQACHDDAIGISDWTKKNDIWNAYNSSITSTENDVGNECRAIRAAKMALNNPLLSEGNMDIGSAKGILVNMTGGSDMTLYEVDRAATYITERVRDPEANIIFGSAFDANLTGCVRVSVVATGIDE